MFCGRGTRFLRLFIAAVVTFTTAMPAGAITPKQEEELSREFMKYARAHFEFIEDPLITGYVNDVGRGIVSRLPTQPFSYRFFVINEEVYNAFAVPAGYIFINSGLLAAMDNEAELAGILSHEIAHVTSRHISDRIKRSKQITAVTLAGIIAGAFLGMRGGSQEAAQAVTSGALAAGQSMSLAFSRDDERQADQLGLRYLESSGYSGRGLLSVMNKIRGKQWYDTSIFPDYLSTHPGSEERMANIDVWLQQHAGTPLAAPPRQSYAFDRAHARLVAVYGDEAAALRRFEAAVAETPGDPVAHYGYGLVLARQGRLERAVVQLRQALEKRAFDPYLLNDLGRVYFLAGKHAEAVDTLEGAAGLAPDNPETHFLLGRTLMETGDLKAASASLARAVAVQPDFPQADYYLGQTYGRLDRLDEAHFHLGRHYQRKRDLENARFHLAKALALTGDPERRETIRSLLREIDEEKKGSPETEKNEQKWASPGPG